MRCQQRHWQGGNGQCYPCGQDPPAGGTLAGELTASAGASWLYEVLELESTYTRTVAGYFCFRKLNKYIHLNTS